MKLKKTLFFSSIFLTGFLQASDNQEKGLSGDQSLFVALGAPPSSPETVVRVSVKTRGACHSNLRIDVPGDQLSEISSNPGSSAGSVGSDSSHRSSSSDGVAAPWHSGRPVRSKSVSPRPRATGDFWSVPQTADTAETHYLNDGRGVVVTATSYNPATHRVVREGYLEELSAILKEAHLVLKTKDSGGAASGSSSPRSLATSLLGVIKERQEQEEGWGFGAPGAIYPVAGAGSSSLVGGATVTDYSGAGSTSYTAPYTAPSNHIKKGDEVRVFGTGVCTGLGLAGLAALLTRKYR